MNKHLSALGFTGSATLFFAALYLFIDSLNIGNHLHPAPGSIRLSPEFYLGLAGANTLVLFGSGMLIGVGFLSMLMFGYFMASREPEDDLLGSTVSRY
jgi:hypothetical protein